MLESLVDIADRIEKELQLDSLNESTQRAMKNIAEEMIEKGELNASDRTLRLLEHERIKYQFFAAMSREVQFEYTVVPNMVVFSEWGAKHLGLSEVIMNPVESPELCQVTSHEDILDLHERLVATTPEAPIIEHNYLLAIEGQKRWYRLVARAMWSDDDPAEYAGAIGKFVDIHDEHERLSSLETLASHDMLTGLFNHSNVKMRIEERLLESTDKQCALVLFDLDHFKTANDQYGHLFGDCVLKFVAQKLVKCLHQDDLAARVGGDEFLIFISSEEALEKRINDIFKVKYKSLVSFDAVVFNRWGQKLYQWGLTDIDKGWDGTSRGHQVPVGVYFIVIEARGADGVVYKHKGDINILR